MFLIVLALAVLWLEIQPEQSSSHFTDTLPSQAQAPWPTSEGPFFYGPTPCYHHVLPEIAGIGENLHLLGGLHWDPTYY